MRLKQVVKVVVEVAATAALLILALYILTGQKSANGWGFKDDRQHPDAEYRRSSFHSMARGMHSGGLRLHWLGRVWGQRQSGDNTR